MNSIEGRGIGGLGAGIGRPVLFGPGNPFDPSTSIRGLDSPGGWSQFKFQLTPKLELNGVFAEDNAFASDVRGFAVDANNFSTILWAQSWRAGQSGLPAAFRLAAFCRIQTPAQLPVYSGDSATNQVNLSMGVLF